MNYKKAKYFFLCVVCIGFLNFSCNAQKNKEVISINDGTHILKINTSTFQFHFENKKKEILAPAINSSGLLINGYPVTSSSIESNKNSEKLVFEVTNSNDENAQVIVSFKGGIAKFTVDPETEKETKIALRLGGMPVAHGLGDAGAFRESFNLLENKEKSYFIENNGGGQRWVSSFAIFPRNKIAGVFFNKGKKTVVLNEQEYAMHSTSVKPATFYYFLGTPGEIYRNYKLTRESDGYKDVKPKFRLFELGWESWDALGWNTNQKTVQEILQKFHKNGYPIRWAVTGSGFWDEGGTTTSFGRWGEKFSNPLLLKNWMHSNDIKWMIGLRTNFVPEGGPYFPKTKERDKNLKVSSFYGNALTTEAKEKGYLVKDAQGKILEITSGVFPIVPCYLLDGNVPGAAEWYQQQYTKWGVDGIKEDTMMKLDSLTSIFNAPITQIANKGGLVMARNGEFISGGTLLRINDTGVGDLEKRIPINYFQYAASGFPNVYSDVAGVHNMHNVKDADRNIRHTWLLSLTAGLAVGAYPEKWPSEKQEVFKKAIDFHYKLAPYMYSAAIEGYHSGFPATLTPLTLAFPKDPNVADIPNYQWMIGESILATPLLKNFQSGKMDVYLPEGVWFDYETGKKYVGPLTLIDFEIPLEKTPCFIGGNGLLVERKNEMLIARIYPIAKNAILKVYDEDGRIQNQIQINNPDWNNINIVNAMSKEKVAFKVHKNAFEFLLEKNQNYKVD